MTEDARELAERLAFYLALEARLTAAAAQNDSIRVFASFAVFAGVCGLFSPYRWLIVAGIVGGIWLAIDKTSRAQADSELANAREMVRRTRERLGHNFDS